MSLTSSDLLEIRNIIESALTKQTNEAIMPIQGELEALRNDIKDIYEMIAELQSNLPGERFQKLSLEEKLLKLNSELLAAAKQAGVTLPR
jgi:chromosome segregation ATPase